MTIRDRKSAQAEAAAQKAAAHEAAAQKKVRDLKERFMSEGRMIDPDNATPESAAVFREKTSGLGHPHLLDDLRVLMQNTGFGRPLLLLVHKDNNRNAAMRKIIETKELVLEIDEKTLKANNRENIKGIIGHELAHVVLGHMDPRRGPLQKVAEFMLAGPGPITRWKARRNELAADERGALIAGGIEGLTNYFNQHLRRQRAEGRVETTRLYRQLSLPSSTHPLYEKRIKNLERFAVTHAAELQAGKEKLKDLAIK